jgi:hypothetical protein
MFYKTGGVSIEGTQMLNQGSGYFFPGRDILRDMARVFQFENHTWDLLELLLQLAGYVRYAAPVVAQLCQ